MPVDLLKNFEEMGAVGPCEPAGKVEQMTR
jgi:hypothetical protein